MGSRSPIGMDNFKGRGTAHCKVWQHSAVISAKMAELIEMPFGLWAWMGSRNHVLDGVHIPHWKGQFWGKGAPTAKYRDFLPWAVQKWLNQSIWRFCCRLGWKYKFNRIRQVAPICPYGGGLLAPPAEYDWTIHLRRRCGLMSNYFDHLLLLVLTQ